MATFLANEVNSTGGDITGRTAHVQIMFSLRWPNTVFDACVSFTFFSKTLDPLITKLAACKLTTETSVFDSLVDVCAVAPLPWQYR